MSSALQKFEPEKFFFNQEQQRIIKEMFLRGATDNEAAALMEFARLRRLNPILKQIQFRKQYDRLAGRDIWISITSIDGFRVIAQRTGEYDGQDKPEFIYDSNGKLTCCEVRVYRKGVPRPFWGIAHFGEFVGRRKDGSPNVFWEEKPHVMLSKCAEAQAFRRGFPEDMSGLYAPEEFDSEVDVTPHVTTAPPMPPQEAPPEQLAEMNALQEEIPPVDENLKLAVEYEPLRKRIKAANGNLKQCLILRGEVMEAPEGDIRNRLLSELNVSLNESRKKAGPRA